ncbi:MAG: DUF2190 family protein [Hyphomicrobiales bacterium]|nr:DUF2190 family protein [Hyphomicrobiales bacterium]
MSFPRKALLVDTLHASAPVAAFHFVKIDGTQAGAGDLVYGVAETDAIAGDDYAAALTGFLSVVAGAPIAKGQRVKSDANGCAIPAADNEAAVGVARFAAVGPGVAVSITRLSLTQ